MEIIKILELLALVILSISLGFYLITNLQWYNYKIERVLFKHHKIRWHFYYFALPIVFYYLLGSYFFIYLIIHLVLLYKWNSKLDKQLIFTDRVKRFFYLLTGFTTLFLIAKIFITVFYYFEVILPTMLALISSIYYEKRIFDNFYNKASQKLKLMPRLNIVVVTASYGKTSIKNFISQTISKNLKVYQTPRSVNTLAGIVQDINNNLLQDTDVYVVEAGAREEGDIKAIVDLLNPQYAVVGTIGPAHIEYFKTIDNIKKTKFEILQNSSIKKAFVIKNLKNDVNIPHNLSVQYFPLGVKNQHSDLDGLSFESKIGDEFFHFETKILGEFNIVNIIAAISVARELGTHITQIQKNVSNLKQVEHRLQRIDAGGKIIIDDSYNGNFDGMSSAIHLVSLHPGRKIIVTPGLVESTQELNFKLAKLIDEVFDLVIITGELNYKILSTNISKAQKIILKDKTLLESILGSNTKSGDLILFANDAPTYI